MKTLIVIDMQKILSMVLLVRRRQRLLLIT